MKGLDPKRCEALFEYEPEQGKLYWRKRGPLGERVMASMFIKGNQYAQVRVDGAYYPAAQVIWAINTGEWPGERLRRLNLRKFDDRVENLALMSDATADDPAWHSSGPYKLVTVTIGGKVRYVGRANSEEEAEAIRAKALGLDLI